MQWSIPDQGLRWYSVKNEAQQGGHPRQSQRLASKGIPVRRRPPRMSSVYCSWHVVATMACRRLEVAISPVLVRAWLGRGDGSGSQRNEDCSAVYSYCIPRMHLHAAFITNRHAWRSRGTPNDILRTPSSNCSAVVRPSTF